MTAISDFDGSRSATAVVEVVAFSIGSYTIDRAAERAAEPLAIDATVQLTATPVDVVESPDTSVAWSSGNESVATIDATGKTTAFAPATATMTARSVFDAPLTLQGVPPGMTVNPATGELSGTPTAAAATIVPGADVTVTGADPINGLSFTLALVSTTPAGGALADGSVDPNGAITYDVAGTANTWIIDVTVLGEVTGASATFTLTFEPLP